MNRGETLQRVLSYWRKPSSYRNWHLPKCCAADKQAMEDPVWSWSRTDRKEKLKTNTIILDSYFHQHQVSRLTEEGNVVRSNSCLLLFEVNGEHPDGNLQAPGWSTGDIWADNTHARVISDWSQLEAGAVYFCLGKAYNKGFWEAPIITCRQRNRKDLRLLNINGYRNNWITTGKTQRATDQCNQHIQLKTIYAIW